jgi:hypothetical protein
MANVMTVENVDMVSVEIVSVEIVVIVIDLLIVKLAKGVGREADQQNVQYHQVDELFIIKTVLKYTIYIFRYRYRYLSINKSMFVLL